MPIRFGNLNLDVPSPRDNERKAGRITASGPVDGPQKVDEWWPYAPPLVHSIVRTQTFSENDLCIRSSQCLVEIANALANLQRVAYRKPDFELLTIRNALAIRRL